MTGTQTQNAIEIKVSEGGSLSVTFLVQVDNYSSMDGHTL